ncbi:sterol carrier protein domain-containing protein [Streptosporangium lutulentum]
MDVERALAARAYSAPVDVVIEVEDAVCPWNARRWRLSADTSGARCTPTEDPADLALPVTVLGAAYLGGGRWRRCGRRGRCASRGREPYGSCPPRCRGNPLPGAG